VSSTDTVYTARFQLPELVEKGRANVLRCPTYVDGARSAPASGTVNLYNSNDSAVVSAAAVTVTGSEATYSLASATVADEDLGLGWRVEWSLTMADGEVHTFRNEAALVLRRLYPPVSAIDLYRLHPDLDPSATAPLVAAGETHQDQLEEAWNQIQLRLINRERRPNLILSPSAFRLAHLYGALELVFRNLSTALNADGRFEALAELYGKKADAAFREISFVYDTDDSGSADASKRRSAASSFWLGGLG